MSRPPESRGEPITDKRQLVEYLEGGSKPKSDWRIGTEHEKFAYDLKSLRPLPYDGPNGIGAILEGMLRFGWEPIRENGKIIALSNADKCAITLEPGGQFELSGAPLETLHQTCSEVHQHLAQVKEICGEIGAGMMGLGFNPKWPRADIPWMPKGRYKIMRDYMPKKGSLGLDMMLRTCTIQTNLDFQDEADMVKKFRVSLALQPIATALFANSPFTEGKPNGFQSFRSHIWTDTDPDRCGILPFVFEDGMGFERYVDYMLDVPMYFIYRDGDYVDVAGQSFRDFIDGRLPGRPGEIPGLGDWTDHMTTVFPEVRLKRFLEMRGADGGPWRRICALPAFWVGLLYDDTALNAAWDLCKSWSLEDHQTLRDSVPRLGLKTPFQHGTVRDIALECLKIARVGLRNRAQRDSMGDDETHFLDTLVAIAQADRTPAEELLEAYHGRWNGSVDPVFKEYAY
ncbi:glutamate--cysteine ligase [Oceanibaculum pacificum]|uniref:Glutamate--cysteine ligase n=1 Tax=Oceanibaculum pacificum TaxID=580166 RepID=A0A154VKT9_9PROT|nr:glutamate--cysteine ligase [Oceanibaculum pacificum]KZD01888.1 glutamate--cysteine ligase [Oceanibaculum pacificum]